MYRRSPPLMLEDFFPRNLELNVEEKDSTIEEHNSDIEKKDLNNEEENLCDSCLNAQDGCPLPDHFIVLPCTCKKLTTKTYVALDELSSPKDPKLLTKDQGAMNTTLSPRKAQALLSDLFSNVKKPVGIITLPDHNELLKLRRKNNHYFVPHVARELPNPISESPPNPFTNVLPAINLESPHTDCHESGGVEPNDCPAYKSPEIYGKRRSSVNYLNDHCYAKAKKSKSSEEVGALFDVDSFLIQIPKKQDDVIVEAENGEHSFGAAEGEPDLVKTSEEPIVIDEPTEAVINLAVESETKANSPSSICGTKLDINSETKLSCDMPKKRRVISIGDYKEKNKNVVDSNADILSHIVKCRSALYGNLVPDIPKKLSSSSVDGGSKENGTPISLNELTSKGVVAAVGANASIENTATSNVVRCRNSPGLHSGKPKSRETHAVVDKKCVENSSKEPWRKKLIRIKGLKAKPEKPVESKWPDHWAIFVNQVKLGNIPVEIDFSKYRVEPKNNVKTRLTPTISPTDSSSGVSSGGSPIVVSIDEKCNNKGPQVGTNVVEQKIPFAPDLELLRDYNYDKKCRNNKRSKSRSRRLDRREMSYDSDCYISDESRDCKRTRYHEPSSHRPKYMAGECSLSPMSYYNYQNSQEFNSIVPVNPHYVQGIPPPIYYHPQTLGYGYPSATSHNQWRQLTQSSRMPDSTEERRVLYVGNLEYSVTEKDIRKRFEKFGCIEHVKIISKPNKNFGFITYTSVDHVLEALKHGNDDENLPVYNLGFGGRKEFCDRRYMDLDNDEGFYHSNPLVAKYDTEL